jgi:hypothetical protein
VSSSAARARAFPSGFPLDKRRPQHSGVFRKLDTFCCIAGFVEAAARRFHPGVGAAYDLTALGCADRHADQAAVEPPGRPGRGHLASGFNRAARCPPVRRLATAPQRRGRSRCRSVAERPLTTSDDQPGQYSTSQLTRESRGQIHGVADGGYPCLRQADVAIDGRADVQPDADTSGQGASGRPRRSISARDPAPRRWRARGGAVSIGARIAMKPSPGCDGPPALIDRS